MHVHMHHLSEPINQSLRIKSSIHAHCCSKSQFSQIIFQSMKSMTSPPTQGSVGCKFPTAGQRALRVPHRRTACFASPLLQERVLRVPHRRAVCVASPPPQDSVCCESPTARQRVLRVPHRRSVCCESLTARQRVLRVPHRSTALVTSPPLQHNFVLHTAILSLTYT